MTSTRNGSISIEIPDDGVEADGERRARWAKVELDDFFWIGRCSICNLRIQGDTQVSRLQATIHREDDGYLLTDMQSRNGTSVNGRRIKSMRLVPGDRVKVGQTLFEFEPENKVDTLFHQGTSRQVGGADLELKSFPCSIDLDHAPGFLMSPVDPSVAQSAPPAPVAPRVSPKSSSLDAFLTIVVDRLVHELSASLALVFLPAIGSREALIVARGMNGGELEVLSTPWDTVHRVSTTFAPIATNRAPPEDGERLLWRGTELASRLVPEQKAPRRLTANAGFSIAMPRVGRVGMQGPLVRPTEGLAWIHVENGDTGRNVARLLDEVASAVNVSVIRFLERGSA